MQVIHKNNRSNEAKNAKSLGLTCFQFAFALLLLSSHTLLEISGSGIAFTTDACSESRENNCFHATITGPSPENTLSKTQSRQGLLPALIFELVGRMSVTSPLRLGWCKSCHRGG